MKVKPIDGSNELLLSWY